MGWANACLSVGHLVIGLNINLGHLQLMDLKVRSSHSEIYTSFVFNMLGRAGPSLIPQSEGDALVILNSKKSC